MDTGKIGRFIAENRKKHNMTQVQLAQKLGVTGKTVSRWETATICRICLCCSHWQKYWIYPSMNFCRENI